MKIKVFTITAILCLFSLAAGTFGSCKSVTTTEKITILATDTVSTTIIASAPTLTIKPAISRDQALAISSRFVPDASLPTAKFYAEFSPNLSVDGVWGVSVYNLSITQDELLALGWANSEFSNTGMTPPVYFSISVDIDGVTGAVLRKNAGGLWLGPGPGDFVPQ